MANDQDTFHADLSELLTILGMGDHSRSQSPHEVFQEAMGVLRERLSLAAPTPTPPCLGEREAVARVNAILSDRFVRWRWSMGAASQAQLAEDLTEAVNATLRAENENLRADLDAAKTEVTKLCWRVHQMNQDWAAECIEWLRSSDIDRLQGVEARALTAEAERDAAIARAEEAEEETRDARYKADCAEEDECDALGRAEEAESKLATLTAKLAQAEGEVATMRRAFFKVAMIQARELKWLDPTGNTPPDLDAAMADLRAALTTPEPPHGD